jgi:hypothetical protein
MIKVQLWENKELFKANEGLEKPIIGLLRESTFDKFKYLKDSIKCAGPNKTFIAVPVDVFNSSILGFAYREVHWANSEHEKDLWQKLIDDFDTHKFDNYKDRIVVIKEV